MKLTLTTITCEPEQQETQKTQCQLLWKKKTTATLREEDVQLYLATAVRIANMCSWLSQERTILLAPFLSGKATEANIRWIKGT